MALDPRDYSRLATVLERMPEVSDEEATPEVRATLAEVRATIRVPFVGALFRTLASDPPFLLAFWSAVRGPLGTRWAEREADRIRTHALFAVPHPDFAADHCTFLHRRGIDEASSAAIAEMQETVHYALPKLLLAAAAGALALRGVEQGGGRPARADDSTPLDRGPAPSAVRPDLVPLGRAAPEIRRLLEGLRDLHGHPIVANYFRALARWPAYLERASADLATVVGSPRYRAAALALATLADVAVRGNPHRFVIHVEPAVGREDMALVLTWFHERYLPELILDISFLRALLDGERRARTNRFSLTATELAAR